MKHIKQYINESLFDDEDDLMDNKLSAEAIGWFDEHVKFVKSFYYETIPAREAISVSDNGTISFQIPHGCDHIEYYEQPPKWIKFDEKTWKNTLTYIRYDITSQKDIERIPRGQFNRIAEIQNNKTHNLTLNEFCNINSKNIKNITYTDFAHILVGVKDINQLTEIKFTKYSNENCISLYYNMLGDMLSKEHGRLKTKGFVNKYRDVLTKMYNNNVYALELDRKKYFVLKDILR